LLIRNRRWIKSDARNQAQTDPEIVGNVIRLHGKLLGATMALMDTPPVTDGSGDIGRDGALDSKIGPFYMLGTPFGKQGSDDRVARV
jgi:hypothetical protein